MERQKQEKIVKEMISRVKLDGLENRYPRQRLRRATAALPLPGLWFFNQSLLLDEPFSALDNHPGVKWSRSLRSY